MKGRHCLSPRPNQQKLKEIRLRPKTGDHDIEFKIKQAKGKYNDVMGAAKGDTSQQMKGKMQKAVGKAQEKLGKLDAGSRRRDVE